MIEWTKFSSICVDAENKQCLFFKQEDKSTSSRELLTTIFDRIQNSFESSDRTKKWSCGVLAPPDSRFFSGVERVFFYGTDCTQFVSVASAAASIVAGTLSLLKCAYRFDVRNW